MVYDKIFLQLFAIVFNIFRFFDPLCTLRFQMSTLRFFPL